MRRVAEALVHAGFELLQVDDGGAAPIGHRFRRGQAVIDLLAPDHVGKRATLVTIPPARTIEAPGSSRSLDTAETALVRYDDQTLRVRVPSLLGGITTKAASARDLVSRRPKHLGDLALLLSLVEDPRAMRNDLTVGDRRRLRAIASHLGAEGPAWQGIGGRLAGVAALRILTA